jgi:hypothetical protein
VFFTKNPSDVNPAIEGVILSASEYQALLERADVGKAQLDAAKPSSPSALAMQGSVEQHGERTVAVLTSVYTYRTTKPKTVVALGCQRAAVVAAEASNGKLPILNATDDGLAVLVESAGEHTLTLKLQVPVTPRGTKGEVGFDLGLPRAAISTFTLNAPPNSGNTLTVGTRTSEQLTSRKTSVSVKQVSDQPYPLGPTDLLEVVWEPKGTAPTDAKRTVESEVSVRVDETQIVTVAKLRLRGPAGDWSLVLPPNSEVSVERAGNPSASVAPTATPNPTTDPNRSMWTFRTTSSEDEEWLVTVHTRELRQPATDPAHRVSHTVGPYFVATAQHTGKLRVYASPTVRPGIRASTDLRRQDLPASTDEDLVALFHYTAPSGQPSSWATLEPRTPSSLFRVRPTYKLWLTPTGWRLEETIRVTPPPRTELDQLTIELPPGWTDVAVTPEENVELTTTPANPNAARMLPIRLLNPQKSPFELTLSAIYPMPATANKVTLSLPRVAKADEREAKLTAAVSEGWELSGTGFGWEQGQPAPVGELLKDNGRANGAGVSGDFERGVSKVSLSWQADRPELGYIGRTEVAVQDRQLMVSQLLTFQGDGTGRPIRLRGPADLVGLTARPRLVPVDRDEWEYHPPADAGKEHSLTVQFAVKHSARLEVGKAIPIPMLWPMNVTSTQVTTRIWGEGGRRAAAVSGRWREEPPSPSPERDTLPWFTLTATSEEPLALLPASEETTSLPYVIVDRTLVQAVLTLDETAALRVRMVLSRWLAEGIDWYSPAGVVGDVFVDGWKVDPVPSPSGVRIPLPEAKPGKTRCLVDVRMQIPTGGGWNRILRPPVLHNATFRTPARWLISDGGDQILLLPSSGVGFETHWRWQGYGFGPIASEQLSDLEQWLQEGGDIEPNKSLSEREGSALALRQFTFGPLPIRSVPRLAWVAAASFTSFLMVLGVSRGSWSAARIVLMVVAVIVAGLSLLTPHPLCQFAVACQPGLLIGLLVVGGLSLHEWTQRRKNAQRSTFQWPTPSMPEAAK